MTHEAVIHLTPECAASFWAKVDRSAGPTGCWIWTAYRNRDGYGQVKVGGLRGRKLSAHRVSFALTNGPIHEGMCILHGCDKPECVNPAHLRIGTHQQNVDDRTARGRRAPTTGERSGSHKLKEADVRDIRVKYAMGGVTQAELGRAYGVSPKTISDVVNRRRWRHLTPAIDAPWGGAS